MRNGIFHLVAGTGVAIALSAAPASAQKKYDTGATDTEIKIGQTVPFSGPASAYAGIGKTQAAYLKMINDQGGINGRKLNLIQYDDAYSPPKAVEQVRKLVEGDEVLFTFQIIGTPSNAAVQKYLNNKKVPQLLAATGASRFTDPQNAPWTIGFNPNYQTEGRIYAKYILTNHPNAKIGVLYQNDDLGRDYITGLKAGLGAKAASMIVGEVSYELTDPTIDSQIVKLRSLGVDLLYDASTFDTDPFEPQPDGAGTIFPFHVQGNNGSRGFVELPYTLVQDFTLFVVLRERGIGIWDQKLAWIAEHGGMALLDTHPDYMSFTRNCSNMEFPARQYREFLEYGTCGYSDRYWAALPRDVARWGLNHRDGLASPQSRPWQNGAATS